MEHIKQAETEKLKNLWDAVVKDLSGSPRDLQTTVKSPKKTPLWFHASIKNIKNGSILIIENAKTNTPSVSLSQPRRIYQKDFSLIFPFYQRRENGESVSRELSETKGEAKKNQTYIFGVIRSCVKSCD